MVHEYKYIIFYNQWLSDLSWFKLFSLCNIVFRLGYGRFGSWLVTLNWDISERMRKTLLKTRLLIKSLTFWAKGTDVCCLSLTVSQFTCSGCECPPPVRPKNARHHRLRVLLWKDAGTNMMKALFTLCTIQSVFKMTDCPYCYFANLFVRVI